MREFVDLDTNGVITLMVIFGIGLVIMVASELVRTHKYNKAHKKARIKASKDFAEYLANK